LVWLLSLLILPFFEVCWPFANGFFNYTNDIQKEFVEMPERSRKNKNPWRPFCFTHACGNPSLCFPHLLVLESNPSLFAVVVCVAVRLWRLGK